MNIVINLNFMTKLSFIGGLLLAQIMAIILQIQGGSLVNWAVVFIPLWILDLVIALGLCHWGLKKYKDKNHSVSTLLLLIIFGLLIVAIVFESLLSVQLTHPHTYSILGLYSPILSILILIIIGPFLIIVYRRLNNQMKHESNTVMQTDYTNLENIQIGSH